MKDEFLETLWNLISRRIVCETNIAWD